MSTSGSTQPTAVSPTRATSQKFGRMRQQEARAGWTMIAPAAILMLGFLIIPFLMAFGFSFTNQRLISPNPTEFVGMRNFERLLTIKLFPIEAEVDPNTGEVVLDEDGNIVFPRARNFTRDNPDYPELDGLQEAFSWVRGTTQYTVLAGDSVFLRSVVNIFYFAIVIVPVQGGLGLVLALLVNQKLRGINIFRTIYFIPVVISMVIVSILWRFIYDGNNGLLNNLLSFFTLGAFQPIDWLGEVNTAMPAIMMMSIWQAVGFHMVIWLAGLQTIPGSLYEAAQVAGANSWQQFRYVTWPGLRNTAVFVLITITMAAFSLFTQVDIMTRGGPLDATTTIIHQAVQRGYHKQDIAYGSAISVFFFMMVLTIALIQRYLTRDKE
ncbi:MAG: sugar ABC transporter permease [Anaerolineales bacterium]|nr:sugar ABC transporter permease [Anaerolineales bacterium]